MTASASNYNGKLGERLSVKFLLDNGYEVLERNYRERFGEIDIIATKNNILFFIEVKTRKTDSFYKPVEAVSVSKKEKLIKTALLYLEKHNTDCEICFDVIEIYLYNNKYRINHIKNAFMLEETYEIF